MANPASTTPAFASFPASIRKGLGNEVAAAQEPRFESFPQPSNDKVGESSSSQNRPIDSSGSRHRSAKSDSRGTKAGRHRHRSIREHDEEGQSKPAKSRDLGAPANDPRRMTIHATESYNRGPSSQEYYQDQVGDKDALRYGTSASLSAPKYRQLAGGRVLGLPQRYRSVRTVEKSGRGLEVAKAGQPFIPRYASGYKDHRKHLRFCVKPTEPDFSASFLALDSNGSRSGGGHPVSEVDNLSDTQEVDTDVEDDAQTGRQQMEGHLARHPADVESWITYSKAHWTNGRGHRKAELDVSLAILSRAIRSESLGWSVPLHLEYLRISAELWPFQRVDEAWKALLRQSDAEGSGISSSDHFELRLGYLDWIQGAGFGQGDYDGDGVMAVLEDALCSDRLHGPHDQTCEEHQLYIFTRACFLLRRMGYEEKAIASFQALLELTFTNKPGDLGRPFDRALEDFEDYWDSEAPRLGESGARGWSRSGSKDHRGTSSVIQAQGSAVTEPSMESDPYRRWAHAETAASSNYRMPARMHDTNDEETDPHRTIMFSDIRSLMFPIKDSGTAEQLCWTFLHFLGLPIRPPGAPTNVAITNDSHLMPTQNIVGFWPSEMPRRLLPWQSEGQSVAPNSVHKPSTSFPLRCCATDRDTIWFTEWPSQSLDKALIQNVLEVIRHHFPASDVDLYLLAIESATSVRGAMKLAKSRLSQDRENLTLWAAYARLERLKGNVEAARAVYAAAVNQVGSVPSLQESPTLSLVADWAYMEWSSSEQDRCLDILLKVASGHPLGQSAQATSTTSTAPKLAILKARQFYADLPVPMSRPALVLSTIFAYQQGLDQACEVLDRQIHAHPAGSFGQEIAYQFYTEIILHHAARHPGPASIVRSRLEKSMNGFPDNTIFLGEMLSQQAKTGLQSRLHGLTARLTDPNSRLIGMIWAVWAEATVATDLYHSGSGGGSRVRSLLDRALSTENGRHCPILWFIAIEFESRVGRHQLAKKLFYRAMVQIGDCKDLYLLAFQDHLRPHFTDVELGHVVESMAKRGIRLRCDPGDFWQRRESELDLPSDEELEDDELQFLTERQARRPY